MPAEGEEMHKPDALSRDDMPQMAAALLSRLRELARIKFEKVN